MDLRLELTDTIVHARVEGRGGGVDDRAVDDAGRRSVGGGEAGLYKERTSRGYSGRRSSWMSMSVRVLSMKKRGLGGARRRDG